MPEAFLSAYHFVYDEVWIINPSCKFLFWCLKSFQNIILGVLKKKFEKFAFKIFFSLKIKAEILILLFFQKFIYLIVLFDGKYKFRMILAFIWYAYCPCRCKIVVFQKFTCQKLKSQITEKIWIIGCCSKFLWVYKDSRLDIRPLLDH